MNPWKRRPLLRGSPSIAEYIDENRSRYFAAARWSNDLGYVTYAPPHQSRRSQPQLVSSISIEVGYPRFGIGTRPSRLRL